MARRIRSIDRRIRLPHWRTHTYQEFLGYLRDYLYRAIEVAQVRPQHARYVAIQLTKRYWKGYHNSYKRN